MKAIITTLSICLISFLNFSQNSLGEFPYIVGSGEIDGYDIEIRTCPVEESHELPNGRRIGGLNCIISDADNYIGGRLIFKDEETVISSIDIKPKGETAEFIVRGESFSMSFTLETGNILKLEENYSEFITKGLGIWSIHKN